MHVSGRTAVAAAVGVGLVALAVGLVVGQPFSTGTTEHDTASFVLHFQRLLEGRHLEAWLPTAPKPLLTLLYGPLQTIFDDWRPISWLALAAYAAALGLGAWLAGRLAGPVAAAFVVVATLGSGTLLAEVIGGNALIWAVLCWLLAGVAFAGQQPRYGLAAVALLLGTLARVETLTIIAAAGAVLLATEVAWRVRPSGSAARPDRRAWLIVLGGLAAVAIMLVHDQLLTGDPLFWLTVPSRFTRGSAAILDLSTPADVVAAVIGGSRVVQLESLLALVGVVALSTGTRRWAAVGIVGLAGGTSVLLLWIAARGIYISPRYYEPIDLARTFSAGIGLASIVAFVARRVSVGDDSRDRRGAAVIAIGLLVAVGLGLAVTVRELPFTGRAPVFASVLRQMNADLDAALPTLRAAVDAVPGSHDPPPDVIGAPVQDPLTVLLAVPARLRPRMAVDLDLSLALIDSHSVARLEPGSPFLRPGLLVYHDRSLDGPAEGYAPIEVDRPTRYGDVLLTPLWVDAERGVWLLRVDPLPAGEA